MSLTLFKANLKSTWAIVVGLTLFVMIYVTASVAMYDPTSAEKMQQMFEAMPQGFLKALGFDNLGAELTPYMSNYLYGFIMLIFPMIGTSVLAHQLVSKHVDTGSMAYLLSTPNTRVKIVITQFVYLICSLLFVFVINVGTTIFLCVSQWPGMLDVGIYLQLNVVTVMVALTIGALSFLSSCIFGNAKYSIGVGVGIPVIMFLSKMISEISEDLSFFKNLSLYSLVDIDRILSGDSGFVLLVTLVLLGVSASLCTAAVAVFNKKSLVI